MGFLVASQWYELEEAFKLCQERGLIREQVFILGRMGNARQALGLIIGSLGNVPQAIDFVQMQRDPDLWELLISLTLPRPELVGGSLILMKKITSVVMMMTDSTNGRNGVNYQIPSVVLLIVRGSTDSTSNSVA